MILAIFFNMLFAFHNISKSTSNTNEWLVLFFAIYFAYMFHGFVFINVYYYGIRYIWNLFRQLEII